MPRPRTYAGISLHSLEHLPAVLAKARSKRGLSARAAAEQIGITHPTLLRIEKGRPATGESLLKVFAWLDGS